MPTCNICSANFNDDVDLAVHLANDHNTTYLKEKVPRSPPKEKIRNPINIEELERKRTELEILKIEREMTKLTEAPEPDTKLDLWNKMLEQQQQHFNQLLEMNKQHNDLKLEIEKLKIGGETGDNTLEILEMLKPLMPVIADKMLNKSAMPVNSTLSTEATNQVSSDNVTRQANTDSTAEQEDLYKKGIKDGSITLAMAWDDFKKSVPNYNDVMPYDKFKKQFNKIKNSKE